MAKVLELTRIRYDEIGRYWAVELLSSVHGRWMVVGEWASEAAAQRDLRMWRA